MTNPTPHGQVPEALIDLIDAYAETRHRYGRIYNARTEAARNAVIEALSGVQALSAAPAGPWSLGEMTGNWRDIDLPDHGGVMRVVWRMEEDDGKANPQLEAQAHAVVAALNAASPTPPAEQTFITPETGNSASAKGAAITSESGTPPAEQQAQPGAVGRTGCTAGTDEECTRRGCATSCPAQQAAPKAAPGVGNSGFDHQTAADFLNGKTVSDEAVRNFVATSRWAHDERAALSATLLAMHGVLTSREAEIALLKKALLEAETATQPAPDCHHRPPCDECRIAAQGGK